MSNFNGTHAPTPAASNSQSGQNTERTSVNGVSADSQGQAEGNNVAGQQEATRLVAYLGDNPPTAEEERTWNDSTENASTLASRTQ
jgi:hypothetical protein